MRIWTDAGAYGLGEASRMVHANASLEIIAIALTPMLLGAEVTEISSGDFQTNPPT